MKIEEHFKKISYEKKLPIFIDDLAKIAQQGGYTVNYMFNLFSNELIPTIFPINKTLTNGVNNIEKKRIKIFYIDKIYSLFYLN